MSEARRLLEDIQTEAIAGPYPHSQFLRKYFGLVGDGSHKDRKVPASSSENVPPPSNPEDVVRWLNDIYTAANATSHKGLVLPRTIRIMDECPGVSLVLDPQGRIDWGNTLMIGFAVDQTQFSYPLSLAQMYVMARQVFFAQPFRYSLHGILVHGDVVELWVFDRSGMYCSEPLSLKDEDSLLVSIMTVYAKKTQQELGVSAVLAKDEVGTYVASDDAHKTNRLYLQEEPFVDRGDFFGDGLFCYRAKHKNQESWSHVVKLKWRDGYNQPEEDAFNYIQSKGVSGVAFLESHNVIEDTVDLRCSLRHKNCKELSEEPISDDPTHKGLLNFAKEGRNVFSARILTHLVFTPLGRSLHTWRNVLELLTVLRDGIKAHWSLLQDANVLHGDISAGNIIIVGSEESPQGMLIDLDRAMNLDKHQPESGSFAGTRMFTAIVLLTSDPHTYRHDLESFFYLFIWLVICQGREHLPDESETRAWAANNRFDSAKAKLRDMKKERFQLVLDQFDAKYDNLKDLAWTLRAALFRPDDNDELQTGTDATEEGINTLYDAMISGFEQEMAKLQN